MNQSRTIRLPVHVVKELNQVLRCQRQLGSRQQRRHHRRGRGPELARPVADVRAILASTSTLRRWTRPSTSIRPLSSANPWPTKTPTRRMSRSTIWRLEPGARMDQSTSDKQRLVIRHRYGIDECEVQTLEGSPRQPGADPRAGPPDPA